MNEDFFIPYKSKEEIKLIATDFYNRYKRNDIVPVPIERIVEDDLNKDIIPVPGLRDGYNIDGFITNNFKAIYVDNELIECYENRYYFTLAHEIGHEQLHSDVYSKFFFNNIEEWESIKTQFPDKFYRRLEIQANIFAGIFLVPDNHLFREYTKAIKLMNDINIEETEFSDILNDYIATYMSSMFKVSSTTLKIRIEHENLFNQLYKNQ